MRHFLSFQLVLQDSFACKDPDNMNTQKPADVQTVHHVTDFLVFSVLLQLV